MAAVAAALGIALAASQRTSRSADQVAALQTACAGEDPPACAELARRYRAGDGVARDLVKAVRAARDGCEAGEPALCVEAGGGRPPRAGKTPRVGSAPPPLLGRPPPPARAG